MTYLGAKLTSSVKALKNKQNTDQRPHPFLIQTQNLDRMALLLFFQLSDTRKLQNYTNIQMSAQMQKG